MDRIKNITLSSILPLLICLFCVIEMPLSFVKKIRTSMIETMIPLQKGVQKTLRLGPSLEKELSISEAEQGDSSNGSTLATESRVIFREFRSYNNAIWIDIGMRDNDRCGKEVVGVNSPVLSSGSLVGVVDAVFNKYSRVRLITDKKFTPSVRALRGGDQERHLLFNLAWALKHVQTLYQGQDEPPNIALLIKGVEKKLTGPLSTTQILAKGELKGSLTSSMRAPSLLIEGVGFNYQAPDLKQKDQAHLKEGDLLVTTGLDGIFPPNIPVAVVKSVGNLEMDEPFYNIEANLLASHIFHLQQVSVLPSIGFNPLK